MSIVPWQQPAVIQHSQRLLHSFQHWTGRSLLSHSGSAIDSLPIQAAQALFDAPFVVVSHGTEADPIFNYGNRTALTLWEMDWQTLTQMPSRQAAEPIASAERDRLLAAARAQGYLCNGQGIRISRTGRRFQIQNVTVWDVLDEKKHRCGQAAMFDQWKFLSE